MQLPDTLVYLSFQLKKDRWLDRATRVVMVEFTIYSVQDDVAAAVILLLELPQSGGVYPAIETLLMRIGHLYAEVRCSQCMLYVMFMMVHVDEGQISCNTWITVVQGSSP
jgi:hypothetical protein